MKPELRKGQIITVILYSGNSIVEAEVTHNHLSESKKSGTTVPLGGTDFSINVIDVKLTGRPDPYSFGDVSIYEVTLKGKLV